MFRRFALGHALGLALTLAACASAPAATPPPAPTESPGAPTPRPTATVRAVSEPTPSARPTTTRRAPTETSAPTATPIPWQDMPVVPEVSDHVREIYARGLALGRDPHAFAKMGDCGGTPSWFLGPFDGPTDLYRLGEYEYLRETIEWFSGSFGRESVATKPGFNVSSVFAALWADPAQCRPNEGPLICELRVTQATYALVMMGSNDVWHEEEFEPQMRRAIEDMIERGVIPILATKADNVEQDNAINETIVRLAREYDVPLWNFWAAVQHLPDRGLQEDGVHLTWAGSRFDDPEAMKRGWPIRNLTALLVLDAVWRHVTQAN